MVLLLCASAVLLMAVASCTSTSTTENFLQLADSRLNQTYTTYINGTFNEATNAIDHSIRFTHAHRRKLSRGRDVNTILSDLHEKFAYMLLCAGNVKTADEQLESAYKYYKATVASDNKQMFPSDREKPLPRNEFVDFVITGTEKVDAKTGVAWKDGYKLNTNVVNQVKVLFTTAH